MASSNFLLDIELRNREADLEEEYYFQVRETEKYWDRDNYAALQIQSIYKMYRCFTRFQKLKAAIISIQTMIRGYLARLRLRIRKESYMNSLNLRYFSVQAVTIQRSFRGYYMRKFTHDFYARKKFLEELGDQNVRFQIDMNVVAEEERIEELKRSEANARDEFSSLAKNLHHLSSTHQIPGVYNPPYSLTKPTAFNLEVETHLKATFKANYTWKPPTRKDIASFTIRTKRNLGNLHQSTIKLATKS